MTTTVLAQQWISVDGFASGPADEFEIFAAAPDTGEADAYNATLVEQVDVVLLGAHSYRSFVDFWPTADHPMAKHVNAVTKVVASRTLVEAPWGGHAPARVVPDAVRFVRDQRARNGGLVLVWGSLQLRRALAREGELDQLEVFVSPLIQGTGTSLFGADGPYRMRQIDGAVWDSGLARLRYDLTHP